MRVFREAGSVVFPIAAFVWRDVAVTGLPGWRGLASTSSNFDGDRKELAGGFHYQSSGVVSSSLCKNRCILW